MRALVSILLLSALLALSCGEGGPFSFDDDDDTTEEKPPPLATGRCAAGRGQEIRLNTMSLEQQSEAWNTSCSADDQCPDDWRCTADGIGSPTSEVWEEMSSDPHHGFGACQWDTCRPADADEDCGPGVLCYAHDPGVTTGRCAGGQNQGAACEVVCAGTTPNGGCSDDEEHAHRYQCQPEYAGDGGNCIWEDYFEAFCPNGTCDGNPFCPNNATCDTHNLCPCPDNFACAGVGDAASCVEITNPLIGIMPGTWREESRWYREPTQLYVDPRRPACEDDTPWDEDVPAVQAPGDACVSSGYGDRLPTQLVLDGNTLRYDYGDGEHESFGEVLEDGWRIEVFFHPAWLDEVSSEQPWVFVRIGDFEDVAD